MPVDFRLKTPDTLGALLGGGRSTQGSKKGVFGKLFQGQAKSERPKVVANKMNQGEVMLRRTGGGNMRLQGLLRANPGKSSRQAPTSGVTKPTTPPSKPPTLPEQVDALTKAPRGNAGEIEKSLGEIGKLLEKYKDTQDPGELGHRGTLTTLQGELKSALLHVQLEANTKVLDNVRQKMGSLSEQQGKAIEQRGKKSGEELTGLISAQHETSNQIDKSLGEINKLIKQYRGTTNQGEKADLEKLITLRRDLTAQAVLVEFPNLQAQQQKPLSLGPANLTFYTRALHPDLARDPQGVLRPTPDAAFDEITRVAKELTDRTKQPPVLFDNGQAADFTGLKAKLEAQIEKLQSMPGPLSVEAGEARDACVEALKQLSEEIGLRAGLEGTVDRLVLMQDPFGAPPSLVTKLGLDKGTPSAFDSLVEMQKNLEAQKPPLKFRVGACLRDLTSALPHLNDHGSSPELRKNRMALESIEVLTALIAEGEVPALLLGTDAELDKAYLALQQGWGERHAVEELAKQHLRDGKPVPTQKENDDAKAKGKSVATSRFNLTVSERRLERLLKTDRRVWYTPSTWGDKGRIFGEGASSSVLKDKQFLDALKKLGGKEAGRDVAFLIAHISSLQIETLKAEREVLGLHDDFLARRLPFQEKEGLLSTPTFKRLEREKGPDGVKRALADLALARLQPQVDRSNPLAHVGISNADIEEMGLSRDDQTDLVKTVERLHTQGLGNVDEVVETNEAINTVIERVVRSSLTQNNIVSLSGESAEGMGRAMLHDFLIDAVVMERRDAHGDDKAKAGKLLDNDFHISIGSESVGNAFSRMVERAENMVTEKGTKPDALIKLQTSSDEYVKTEQGIVDLMRHRKDVDAEVLRAQEFLKKGTEDLGLDLDPNKPGGLRSAKLVQQALEYHDFINDPNNTDEPAKRQAWANLNSTLDQLKGFDLTRARRPWHQKVASFFGGATRPKIQDLRQLNDVTKAIVFVRETADLLKAKTDLDIADAGEKMDGILEGRRKDQPHVMEFTRQLVRTAVLANWPSGGKDFGMKVSDGRVIESYDPATKRTEIEKMLQDWGLDTKKYAPEIDEVLYGTLTVEDMETWRKEALFSSEGLGLMRAQQPSPKPWDRPIDFMTDRRGMDESTRRAFLSELESFQEGDKLNLKSGMRFTADTNRVSPTGGLGYVRGRLAGSVLGQFLIERGSDGYKLHLRTGSEVKANVDGGIYMGIGPDSENGQVVANASLDVSGGVEGSHANLRGATFSFPPTPEGQRDLIDFVDKMIRDESVTTKDWVKAKDVARSSERSIKGAVSGRAGLKGKLMFCQEEGLGITGEVTAGIGAGWKREQWKSHNEQTIKGEVEIRANAGANLGLYAQLYKFKEGESGSGGTQVGGNVSPDIVGVGVSAEGAYTRKWKHVLNPDGQYTKGEIVRQSNVKSAKDLGLLSTKALDDKLEKDKTFKANFEALMNVMGSEDVLAMTYTTKPEIIERVNILLDRARKLYNEGRVHEADDIAGRAEDLLEDDENYVVSKVSLLTTTTRKEEVTNLNALFFKWENISDSKLEHPALVLSA
jgi:hypothetical protein